MVFPRDPDEWMVWVMGQDAFGGGPVLVFFVFHSAAERLAAAGHDATVRWALGMLAEAVGRPCPSPTAVAVTSWAADPWAGGAYTHIPPGPAPPPPTCSATRSADGFCSPASIRKALGSPTPTAR